MDIEAKTGQKVEFFVVDTLARAIAGGDENSSKDVGALIRAVDFIRVEAKTHALVIHHPARTRDMGGRGDFLGASMPSTPKWSCPSTRCASPSSATWCRRSRSGSGCGQSTLDSIRAAGR